MAKRNFLLGKGERLAEAVTLKTGPIEKIAPYTFDEAKKRLSPMIKGVAQAIDQLPTEACPDDLAVATITVNPEYIAKSYYPSKLLDSLGLRSIGSRSRMIKPEKKSAGREPIETVTTELFVIGSRSAYRKWSRSIDSLTEPEAGAAQIVTIERIEFETPSQKLRIDETVDTKDVYEVVLHVDEDNGEDRYLKLFSNYLRKEKLQPNFKRRFYAGGLCFLELEAPRKSQEYIAQFSLVRLIRTMPSLRLLTPAIRAATLDKNLKVVIPDFTSLDPKIKVAIFDGGIPKDHPILKWVTHHDVPGIGRPVDDLLEHGVGVTSAFLFGHIDPATGLQRPYANVHHYRVLDDIPGKNRFELFEILDRIKDVIQQNNYDFINLSLGPRLPIDDDEVHAWTAVLDDYLSKRQTLATIAVGNDGELDPSIQANRVQVPSDCVNALAVGACDRPDDGWRRAKYSSVGPGRSPGLTKPDLVEFGGSRRELFLTLDSANGRQLRPTAGTSFAAPSVMRLGAGIKAHFGNALSPLAIRTLLIHSAESAKLPKHEIGFGRVARTLDEIVVCDDNVIRVVFQGRISASKFIRIPIPVPKDPIDGRVTIKATLCYATAIDPHHPENYTRSGLQVFFRPDKNKKNIDPNTGNESFHPATKPFFASLKKEFATEVELRRDALKWENCLHANKGFNGETLNSPMFDIHYNARQEGQNDTRSHEIEYALVITVQARKVPDLYDRVVRRYATILEQLTPTIDIPLHVRQE